MLIAEPSESCRYVSFDLISHLIDGFYFFCSEMAVPSSQILEFTEFLIQFSLKHKIISKDVLARFLKNLKTTIQSNTKIHLQRPKVLSETPNPPTFNPSLYKKYLNRHLIGFSQNSFNIDFRELLVNNLSFGNPIGCIILCKSALDSDPDWFDSSDLSEVFLYLIIFGVVNDSINPVVFQGLSRLFAKIAEDASSGDYLEEKRMAGVQQIFDGVLRAEFWLSSLYELSVSVDACQSFFFRVFHHYVLKYETFVQSCRLLRRIIQWAADSRENAKVEHLYMAQSLTFLTHMRAALEQSQSSQLVTELEKPGGRFFAKRVFSSIVFFAKNYLVKIEKNKLEKEVIAFLAQKECRLEDLAEKQLEQAILFLFREVLKACAKQTPETENLRRILLENAQESTTQVMQTLDKMVQSQLESVN